MTAAFLLILWEEVGADDEERRLDAVSDEASIVPVGKWDAKSLWLRKSATFTANKPTTNKKLRTETVVIVACKLSRLCWL